MNDQEMEPSSPSSASAEVGRFAVLEPGVVLQDRVSIGHHSVLESGSSVGTGTAIGNSACIGADVRIGADCQIGSHVVVHPNTIIGDNVRIDDGTVIGKQPMRSPNSAVTHERVQAAADIGSGCLLGAGVVVYAGCTLGRSVLIADLATIREDVTIGDFTIVGRGVAIENTCSIGRYCKLETNAYITAYSTLEDRVFIAPGVLTSNDRFIGRTEERFKFFEGPTVRRGGRLGLGAVVLPAVKIGPDAVVAAGAVMTHNADDRVIYAGVPARPIGDVPQEQLLDEQGWDE